eukprot:6186532-Pleurochrysis_carterae.AAC.1
MVLSNTMPAASSNDACLKQCRRSICQIKTCARFPGKGGDSGGGGGDDDVPSSEAAAGVCAGGGEGAGCACVGEGLTVSESSSSVGAELEAQTTAVSSCTAHGDALARVVDSRVAFGRLARRAVSFRGRVGL